MNIEDKILLNEVRKRNKKVFEALFYEYYPHLTRYAEGFIFGKQACEDIVQNLFVHLWENCEKINIETSVKAYFYQSVKNRCLNHLRDLQIHDRHKLLHIEAAMNADDPSNWIDAEIFQKIQEAIEKLPPRMAELFKQKYLEGKKYHELANLHGISENTVKTQIQRAKEKLRHILLTSTSLKFFL
jgi:RNA polymerase sigma-70 factor (ECF subfamily)